MKQDIILWVQSPRADNKHTLSYNGSVCHRDSSNYNLLFNRVATHNFYKKIASDGSSSIYYRKVARESVSYIIYSNYLEEDETSRKIAYMARIIVPYKANADQIKALVKQESSLYGYTPEDDIYDQLAVWLKKKTILNLAIIVFLCLAALSILCMALS